MPEAYQSSNLTTFNFESMIHPKSCEKVQSTYNKATFVNGSDESIPPVDAVMNQLQKPNGQALFMYSKPKIKQFFQNLSSNSSLINV